MQERKINLREILDSYCDVFDDDIIGIGVIQTVNSRLEDVKKAIKEACRQTLKLAAENAVLLENGTKLNLNRYLIEADDTFHCEVEIDVDKQSILDTIKQIE